MVPMKGQLIDRQNCGNIPFGAQSLRASPVSTQGMFSIAGVENRIIAMVVARLSRGVSDRKVIFILNTGSSTIVGQ